MKVELHINGSLQVQLIPETPTETLVLNEMRERAGKGKAAKLGGDEQCTVVSVEQ